ncbi:MFS transporter [Bradyrhizobium tropiciagri]|uniref:MFS transporter n=1 Tax=Bradyrhizobium tropiciagri TaxID=312253 RepID=UPI00067DDA70|nr:MFS transporter [Bradyrhizobium tropiciagri]
MTDRSTPKTFGVDGIVAPLKFPDFQRIWIASLLSYLGILMQGVGAAWAMTQMTSSADKVALVQTALTLPVMVFSIPAGAIADMYDRRIVMLVALTIALCGATALTAVDWLGCITPNLLLFLCFVVGSGMALMWPSWLSSASEQVPAEALPAAVALDGISYNFARSCGPAVGGLVVASAGTVAAFGANALLYLPVMVALCLWTRVAEPLRLPREQLRRAIIAGVRYIGNSPSMKIVLTRSMTIGAIGSSILALMPLVARDLLHGGPQSYGIMLGAFGVGAIIGAVCVGWVRTRMTGEAAVRACTLSMSGVIAAVALSRNPALTAIALVLAGAVWTMTFTMFNIGMQLSAPRWVAGRSLAAYQASYSGGVAIASWAWGRLTDVVGVEITLLISAMLMLASPLMGLWLRMPPTGARGEEIDAPKDPEVRLELTERSGPVVLEIEYRVAQENARVFHSLMQDVQLSRQRNGAYGWSIARDMADPELWTERYHCPTWLDYLRQRHRWTQSDLALDQQLAVFHIGPEPVRIRRMLERPFGSVRKENVRLPAGKDLFPADDAHEESLRQRDARC